MATLTGRHHFEKMLPGQQVMKILFKMPSLIWFQWCLLLTRWGRVTHICVSKISIIGSDNGLSPGRRQAIIWTNAGILLIGPLGTNFSEDLIEILTFSFTKVQSKVSSAKWWPFCLGLNVLKSDLWFTIVTTTLYAMWCKYWTKRDGNMNLNITIPWYLLYVKWQ